MRSKLLNSYIDWAELVKIFRGDNLYRHYGRSADTCCALHTFLNMMLLSALFAATYFCAEVGSNQGPDLMVNGQENPTTTGEYVADPSAMDMPTAVVEPFPEFPGAVATSTLNSAATNLPGSGLLVGGMLLAVL